MTKKDYTMLARVIGEAWAGQVDDGHVGLSRLVDALARELQRDNPKFNKMRFMDAVEDARMGE